MNALELDIVKLTAQVKRSNHFSIRDIFYKANEAYFLKLRLLKNF